MVVGRVVAVVVGVVTLVASVVFGLLALVESAVLAAVKAVWLSRRVRDLLSLLDEARNYGEYALLARELDRLTGREAWKKDDGDDTLYDAPGVAKRTAALAQARADGDWMALVSLLRKGTLRNVGGIGNPQLYAHTYVGTKRVVEAYVREVVAGLRALAVIKPESPVALAEAADASAGDGSVAMASFPLAGGLALPTGGVITSSISNFALSTVLHGGLAPGELASFGEDTDLESIGVGRGLADRKARGNPFASHQDKFNFFYEVRQSYGRSSLLLSGGASNGMYHLGIIKTLFEAQLLPRVISGSSAGALVAAMVAVRTDDELPGLFLPHAINLNAFDSLGPGGTFRKIKRLVTQGVLMDITKLEACLRDNIGDVTFVEAYRRTGRILNITVSSTQTKHRSRLLNYLSAPSVLIWSAALASCAIPYVYAPVEIVEVSPDGQTMPWEPSGELWMDGSIYHDLPMARLSELFNVNSFIVSQVNPHVVPFLSAPRLRTTRLPSRFLAALGYVVTSEVRHRLSQLARLRLLPAVLAQVIPLLEQTYKGHITFIPQLGLSDYLYVISNPTQDLISNAIDRGQRTAWEKLDRLEASTRIERELEALVQALRREINSATAAAVLSASAPATPRGS
ncbi:triacylglycerol lipase [Thecamonas trahens ATCC 50062]|uniref:Triacylglycerol lipase n=1 Tax=Thecamonas trahens ATCC 50062 TaxID=461836 RepID=A0A0L0D4U1_THETB|nr:triacylglycerol lipase [Thecamonas trahens ATCC 50062]KNC47265.1 triacylglycerol lipase [Thecamonas trahens ATCC 50062]|eukprot:XP_013759608.1 triacylglycerol lipase [Thecamonas trahens ATCC 50062]